MTFRFFFLSNDELLQILSETKDPMRVEPHLKKCFEGIKKLSFNQLKEIEAMKSEENEKVRFVRVIKPQEASGLVEKWLLQVEEVMRLSLKSEAVKAINAYSNMKRVDWISTFPGQISIAVNAIYWTKDVTKVYIFV
jgi:dynein heavy chain